MRKRSAERRFGLLELILVSAFLSVVFWVVGSWSGRPSSQQAERAALAEKYGPSHYSQFEEEWAVRDYFGDKPKGFFVDVGANDYRHFSNTYYLAGC